MSKSLKSLELHTAVSPPSNMMMLSATTSRTVLKQHRPAGCVRPCPARLVRPLRATPKDDDSEAMLKDNWETVYSGADDDLKQGNIQGSPVGQETRMKAQDIGQGKMEPDAGSTQPVGTEYGATAEERTSSSGADTGSAESQQQMANEPPVSEAGGRFDEEPVLGDHPYDPRPRERGHGVPPHKDASNTGPGPAGGSDASSGSDMMAQSEASPQGETADTSARDEFKRNQM